MTTGLYNVSKYSRFNLSSSQSDITVFVKNYGDRILKQLAVTEQNFKTPFYAFAEDEAAEDKSAWIQENYDRFLKNTRNGPVAKIDYLSQLGYITSMVYSPDGSYVIVGHSTGYIEVRHGSTGVVLCTLRNMQFPPKPIYAIKYSRIEERVCYAACMDGNVYRVEIPNIDMCIAKPPDYCIRADPALESLKTQFYGSPGIHSNATPFVTQRNPAQALDITADSSKIVVGYGDASVKIYDMETQDVINTYKVHKLRLQFIPKKLQRMHAGQVSAVRCHDTESTCFASAAWDRTLRNHPFMYLSDIGTGGCCSFGSAFAEFINTKVIPFYQIWDTRCHVGCMMTFEGVNVLSDSIDLNRDQCVTGSWMPSEALTLWDLKAKKRISIIRIQNRRADVDGEYLYACKYWRSLDYNRKGKYAIIGGSGTNCIEVINLHNRYISCSYPAEGSVLSVASYQERIAFGGTATVFNIVAFHDPKHEKYVPLPSPSDYRVDTSDYYKTIVDYEDEELRRSSYTMPEKPRSRHNSQRLRISTTQTTYAQESSGACSKVS